MENAEKTTESHEHQILSVPTGHTGEEATAVPQRLLLAAFLPCFLLVSACRTPYMPYECMSARFDTGCIGYSEVQLAPNVYRVRFEGGNTRLLAADLSLLRSAELTLESGFRYFAVVKAIDETQIETRFSRGTYHPPQTRCYEEMNGRRKCTTARGYWTKRGISTPTLGRHTYTIKFVQGPTQAEKTLVYDALSIQRNLRRKYELPAAVETIPSRRTNEPAEQIGPNLILGAWQRD